MLYKPFIIHEGFFISKKNVIYSFKFSFVNINLQTLHIISTKPFLFSFSLKFSFKIFLSFFFHFLLLSFLFFIFHFFIRTIHSSKQTTTHHLKKKPTPKKTHLHSIFITFTQQKRHNQPRWQNYSSANLITKQPKTNSRKSSKPTTSQM